MWIDFFLIALFVYVIYNVCGRKWEKVGNMFFGSFERSLDDKNRLVLPSKLREDLGVKVFIMKGYDGALSIYQEVEFSRLVNQINSLPFNEKNSRDFLRVQLASVCQLDVDKAGRVQIPTQLISKYHISKDVLVLGAGDHIEVWDKKFYSEYMEAAESSFEEIAERLGKDY